MIRPDKIQYYLNLADAISERGTCLRRQYGAVIVKDDEVVSTGYVGAPRGVRNCSDIGECYRIKNNVQRGTAYEKCWSVHAEQNAIISAPRNRMIGATMYICGREVSTGDFVENADSCVLCKRMIINAGIKTVIVKQYDEPGEYNYRVIDVENDWVKNPDVLIGGY